MDENDYPDPNAPWWEKINPCHINHYKFLDPIQTIFECYGSFCKCCSGARVLGLCVAYCLLNAGCKTIANIIYFIVMFACCWGVLNER